MRKKQEQRPRRGAPEEFCEWWYPTGVDETSGASVGGHPDAQRVWARKEPGKWNRRTYGLTADIAWSTVYFRDEYQRWVDAGRPEVEPFVSIAVTLRELSERMASLKVKLGMIAKPMPTEDRQPLPAKQAKGRVVEEEEDDGSIPF